MSDELMIAHKAQMAAILVAERALTGEMPDAGFPDPAIARRASVVRRQIETIAQIVEKRLQCRGRFDLPHHEARAALHFRIVRSRRRTAAKKALRCFDMGSEQQPQPFDLRAQEADLFGVHVSSTFINASDATSADGPPHRLSGDIK